MIPPPNAIEAALRRLEMGIHRGGWDQAPGMHALSYQGGVVRFGNMPLDFAGGDLGSFLMFAAHTVTTDTVVAPFVKNLAIARFAGLAVSNESWANHELTPLQRSKDPRKLADIPGSYETRDITAVDVAGRVYLIHRRRGEKPHPQMPTDITGRFPRAILTIVTAIARQMPAGTADLAALEAVRLPTMNEAEDKIRNHRAQNKATG